MNQSSNGISGPYNPRVVEDKIYRLWEKSGFFNPDLLPKPRKKTFTITVPPPNITGSLHMGHALNATIQDILIRKKRMEGYKTLWLPGTDHASIATQYVVEKELKKEGLTRHDLGKEKFLERVWQWKEKYGHIILEQFKKLGSSMDWSRTRFTMDPAYQKSVEAAFLHYYKKGWIYKSEKVVSWCSRCTTSLSDLELEHKEEQTILYYLKYPLADGRGEVVVATVRPETMLGDSAVAVNPKDQRYKHLIGSLVMLPIQNREIPIIADSSVEMEFGTGAVKVTPAHDLSDAEMAERHKLKSLKIINGRGRMTPAAGKEYEGLKVLEARQKIVGDLKAQHLIIKEEPYKHNLSVCYRCGTIIEPLPTPQWFLKMDQLAALALKAVKSNQVRFQPKRWEKIYFDWLKNIRDWPLSRQLWWGHKIPLKGEEDTLDTWFSSALWPLATLGWPNKTKDFKNFYPTQVLSTARDIINLWVARMIYSGLEFSNKAPFEDVIIHATILTKDGQRMSKSLGTGIDPLNLIKSYGADATRFGLIWQAMGGQDIRWSEEHVNAGKKFANKIWNAARFVLLNLKNNEPINPAKPTSRTMEDKKTLAEFSKVKKSVSDKIDSFDFGQALHDLYEFFWRDFCDQYIESAKLQMTEDRNKDNTRKILVYILLESLKLIHPFMPFVTEEIWGQIPLKNKKMLLVEKWPK